MHYGIALGWFHQMGRPFMIDLLFLSFVDSQAVESEVMFHHQPLDRCQLLTLHSKPHLTSKSDHT